MKTKKESKFSLDKFEVAKLKNNEMRKIVGQGNDNTIGSKNCVGGREDRPA